MLELLFVVAILATIATFALSSYRNRTIQVKITRAAAEVQQILQAGSAYYADKKQWPVEQAQTGEEFERQYLPFGRIRKNPWEAAYHYKPLTDSGDLKKSHVFQVETLVPTEHIANQMAAHLPNSEVESEPGLFKVKAQVTIPAQDILGGGAYTIVEIGEIGNENPGTDERSRYLNARLDEKNRSRRVDFDCPSGMKRGLFIAFSGIHSGNGTVTASLSTFKLLHPVECNDKGCQITLSLDYWGVRPCNPECWLPNSSAKIQYIAYCN